ncbi:MAG: aldehyde ferredoxin oxidoreductase family protein [Deltaproteobacteria bacterium]|nr:aldehyde ferredoxin oxidoreductase family protein [Deltaproteobacteria bacterium]
MDFGYMGKILQIDLTNQTWEEDHIHSELRKKFLGGRGLGLRLLYEVSQVDGDAFSEDNVLIFMTGPYTGTGVFSAFYNVTTKSPLTGLAASSHSGGTWGPMLKRAGYDALVIKGRSPRPCYLSIIDGKCHILDAGQIWGKGIKETQTLLQNQHGRVAVAGIGPAGERLVRFASIMNDMHRAAGRSGVGAVMGSKNLKAIVVGGNQKIQYRDRDGFMAFSRKGGKKAMENATAFASYGTSMVFSLMNEVGALPSYNFRAGHFERVEDINGEALKSGYFVRDKGCFNCPLKCGNIHSVKEGPFSVDETEGPEYETLMSFGPNCGNANLASIIKANDLCNDLGMDTISAGNTIALLIDLHENGLVQEELIKGLDLGWGKAGTIVKVLQMMAHRKGLGDILAEGSVRAARYLGAECEGYVIHCKNQDFPGYEVRRAYGTGLSFATSSRGADHLRGCMYVNEIFQGDLDPLGFSDEKIQTLIEKENWLALVDSLVMCKFGQRNGEFTPEVLPEVLACLTGMEISTEELLQIGERIYNLERIYNISADKDPDVLPERLFNEDLDDGLKGGQKIKRNEFDAAVNSYYQTRQWDPSGRPTTQKLDELGLAA